jgi:hypothetical protein
MQVPMTYEKYRRNMSVFCYEVDDEEPRGPFVDYGSGHDDIDIGNPCALLLCCGV